MGPGDSQQTRALLYEKEQVVSSLQQLQHFDDYAGAAAANGFDSYGFPIQKYRVLPQVPLFNDGDGKMLLSNNRTAAAASAAVTSAGRGSEYIHACEVGNESLYFVPADACSLEVAAAAVELIDVHQQPTQDDDSTSPMLDGNEGGGGRGPGSTLYKPRNAVNATAKFPLYI